MTLKPIAFPRSSGGKTRLKRAMEVPNIIAAPMPVRKRAAIRNMAEGDSKQSNVQKLHI